MSASYKRQLTSAPFSENNKRMSETVIPSFIPDIIDLTASPEKPVLQLDHQLKNAIVTANQDILRNAMLEICKQIPDASKILALLLLPPPTPSMKKRPMKALKKKVSKKRKRVRICENCEGDADASDWCYKFAMMQEARCARIDSKWNEYLTDWMGRKREARNFLGSAPSY